MTHLTELLKQRAPLKGEPGDYRENGLLYCGKCHTPRQCRVTFKGIGETIQPILCKCRKEKQDAEEREFQENQKRIMHSMKVVELQRRGIQDASLRNVSFEKSDMDETLMKCKRYADNWEQMFRSNTGLLLWGNTGNGKTHAAACIVNQLVDQYVPCLITSFPRILNSGFDKQKLVEDMKNFDLVVIDDLGAERQSEYALETVYLIIDERYKTGKPLIVTTNLTLAELKRPKDMTYQRIYDRVLEMCVPIAFNGASRRGQLAKGKMEAAKAILNGSKA